MKRLRRWLTLLLCAGLCLGLWGGTVACRPSAPEIPDADSTGGTGDGSDSTGADVEEPDGYKKSLKILAIGNSFADDALWYAVQTAKSLGSKNVTVGILYIGGCSIQQHAQNSASNARAYTYRKTTDGKLTDNDGKNVVAGVDRRGLGFYFDTAGQRHERAGVVVRCIARYVDGVRQRP